MGTCCKPERREVPKQQEKPPKPDPNPTKPASQQKAPREHSGHGQSGKNVSQKEPQTTLTQSKKNPVSRSLHALLTDIQQNKNKRVEKCQHIPNKMDQWKRLITSNWNLFTENVLKVEDQCRKTMEIAKTKSEEFNKKAMIEHLRKLKDHLNVWVGNASFHSMHSSPYLNPFKETEKDILLSVQSQKKNLNQLPSHIAQQIKQMLNILNTVIKQVEELPTETSPRKIFKKFQRLSLKPMHKVQESLKYIEENSHITTKELQNKLKECINECKDQSLKQQVSDCANLISQFLSDHEEKFNKIHRIIYKQEQMKINQMCSRIR